VSYWRTATGLGLAILALMSTPAVAGEGPWIEVAGGEREDFSWSVEARSPDGRADAGSLGARRPCVRVVAKWWLGPYAFNRSRYRSCAEAPGPLSAADPPLIATGMQPARAGRAGLSSVGILLAPAVRRLRVTAGGGISRTLPLHSLHARRGRAGGLGRLRYAAFVVRGTWCAERLVSLGAAGRVLWDSGPTEHECPTAG
jgi:hypothetical protein